MPVRWRHAAAGLTPEGHEDTEWLAHCFEPSRSTAFWPRPARPARARSSARSARGRSSRSASAPSSAPASSSAPRPPSPSAPGPSVDARVHRRRRRLRVRRPLLRRVRVDDSRSPAAPTPTPTRRWASSSPGSSAGTWCSSTRSARRPSRSRGASTSTGCSSGSGCAIPYEWSHSPFEAMAATGVSGIMNIPAVFILGVLSAAAHPRHAGVGVRQQHHRHHQGRDRPDGDRDRLGLHQPGQPHAVAFPAPTTYTTPQGVTHAYGGIMGILGAAGVVFFAFIGFDAVSTAAQEAKNPKRDMPIGILGSLVVCTVLYVLFSYVLSGVATVEDFRIDRPRSVGGVRDHEVHDRLRVAVEARHGRDSRRLLVGHPGHAARPVARVLLDEPRRPGAEDLLGGAPEVPDAVQVEHALLRLHGAVRARSFPATSSAR